MTHFLYHQEIKNDYFEQKIEEKKELILAQGQVNGHNVLVQWKAYLTKRTDKEQIIWFSPYLKRFCEQY